MVGYNEGKGHRQEEHKCTPQSIVTYTRSRCQEGEDISEFQARPSGKRRRDTLWRRCLNNHKLSAVTPASPSRAGSSQDQENQLVPAPAPARAAATCGGHSTKLNMTDWWNNPDQWPRGSGSGQDPEPRPFQMRLERHCLNKEGSERASGRWYDSRCGHADPNGQSL